MLRVKGLRVTENAAACFAVVLAVAFEPACLLPVNKCQCNSNNCSEPSSPPQKMNKSGPTHHCKPLQLQSACASPTTKQKPRKNKKTKNDVARAHAGYTLSKNGKVVLQKFNF